MNKVKLARPRPGTRYELRVVTSYGTYAAGFAGRLVELTESVDYHHGVGDHYYIRDRLTGRELTDEDFRAACEASFNAACARLPGR